MATTSPRSRVPVPRQTDDYTPEAAKARRDFLAEQAGASLEHVGSYSFDPSVLPGNVEHFTGVAQVPLGIAVPLLVDGEHAQGEFYVPMATAEGTLVASYNRGMKLLHEAGGVTTTIMDDRMQRAPAFLFESARARARSPRGSTSTSTRSARSRSRPPGRAVWSTSRSTPPAASSTRASTTRPATPRART